MKKHFYSIYCLTFLIFACTILTSCYRMPNEDEYSVIPSTNNPDVVGSNGVPNWMPGAGF